MRDLQQLVVDDDTPLGGKAFVGETLADFLEEVELPMDADLVDVNTALAECGLECISN